MGPVRPEGEDLDVRRKIGVEHAVVPIGRLMECVSLREPRHADGNAVSLAVLLELQNAALFSTKNGGIAPRRLRRAVRILIDLAHGLTSS